jgi:DNA-binding NarL/FixJ family response regulator
VAETTASSVLAAWSEPPSLSADRRITTIPAATRRSRALPHAQPPRARSTLALALGAARAVVTGADAGTRERLARMLAAAGMAVADELDAGPGGRDVVVHACDRLDEAVLAAVAAHAERWDAPRRLVVVGTAPWPHTARRALRAAVDGLVLDEQAELALAPAVAAVLAAQIVMPSGLRDHVETPLLSRREWDVLVLAASGCTNDEIGRRLYLATSTVKSHISSAFAKLDVSSRKEAIAVLQELSLQPPRSAGQSST